MIELMIVVAIIGILAAIAIPSYQDYTARAQVTEAVNLVGGFKTPLVQYYNDEGVWPGHIRELGGTIRGEYVASVTIANSNAGTVVIHATMKSIGVNANIQNKIFGIETNDGGETWQCGNLITNKPPAAIDRKYLPDACK